MSYIKNMNGQGAPFTPGYEMSPGGSYTVGVTDDYRMKSYASALTDEGGYISNFCNSSLAVTIGTCTFTNGSTVVTGTNLGSYDLHGGDYVYITSQLDTAGTIPVQVMDFTDTVINLVEPWTGTTATAAASRQIMNAKVGTGASVAVSNGNCVITSGTSNGAVTELERDVDYYPLRKRTVATFSAAPGANSTSYIGFYDESVNPTKCFARFKFTGTSTTSCVCESGWNATGTVTANETQSTTVVIPGIISTAHQYEVIPTFDGVKFLIDRVLVAWHQTAQPHMGDQLTSTIRIVNGTGASSYTITVAVDACKNYNEVDVNTGVNQQIDITTGQERAFPIWAPNNTTPLVIDTQGYNFVRFHIPAAGTASVLTPSWSDDNSNFTTGGGFNPVAGGAYVATITNATAGIWTMPAFARYLKLTAASTQTGGVIVTLSNRTNSTINPTTTVTATNLSCNVAQMNGVTTTMGNGVAGTGVQRVAIASDNTAFTVNAGPTTAAANACSMGNAASLTVANIKASAGALYGLSVVNKTAGVIYIQTYNTAGTPVLGVSAVNWIPVAASSTLVIPPGTYSLANFATGIGIGASTTPGSTGTPGTAPDVAVWYK